MRIDLHTHSSVSDGTETPAELLATAKGAGLDVVALTDHDTTDGWAEAESNRPPGLTVVPGMELSCRWFLPDQPPISVHLLAYLFDPAHPGLAAERARLRSDRLGRAERIVQNLVAGGYPLVWDDIVAGCRGGVVGRPHVARALVAAGAATSVDDAFASLLHHGSPYYVAKADTEVLAGIRLVREAGGVPVFAHGLARRRGRVLDDDAVASMAQAGLLGLEVDHPDHDAEEREHMAGLAKELGLVATGSSDYHGTNKTTPIAVCTTAPDQLDRLIALGTGSPVLED
jgi:predicted metal-dependent phosphoesterase TrpH